MHPKHKHPLQSKTIYGLAFALFATALALFATIYGAADVAVLALTVLVPAGLAFAGYGRFKADRPLSLDGSASRSGYVVAALLTPLLLLSVGCASTAADQGTSSGWTDAPGWNVTVHFYTRGEPSDAEAVEGDTVPAGRVVLSDSPITINVQVGSEGASDGGGEAGSTNAPQTDATVDVSPLP